MKKILLIDNYDSFSYNLVQLVEEIVDHKIDVLKNDQISISEIVEYQYIIISPGPGLPDEAGQIKTIIGKYASSKNIFGVCLGLQAIGEVFGCKLINLQNVYHGIQSEIFIRTKNNPIFQHVKTPFKAGRYHSWVIDKSCLSPQIEVTCIDQFGEVMAIKHKTYSTHAVQFHPESIMTPMGKLLMTNFLSLPILEKKYN